MHDEILLIRADAEHPTPAALWPHCFVMLRRQAVFHGGSAIGAGDMIREQGGARADQVPPVGCIPIQAADIAGAMAPVAGNRSQNAPAWSRSAI